MGKISTFFANAKAEIHKVIFPTKVQVRQAFLAVILVVTVISIFLALVTERTLYSGYAFAHIDLDTDLWHKIQSLPRVSRFIGEQKTPTVLPEKDVKNILDKLEQKSAPRPKVDFETGEMVRIVDGPFSNFTGMVEEYDLNHGTLKLNVSIFGRNTPVEILYTQVEKII